MVHGVVLIRCENDPEAARAIAALEGVPEVYSRHELDRLFSIGFEEG